jgi:hypothetical protein
MEGCDIDVLHNSSLLSHIEQNAIDILVSIREVADVDSPSNTLLPKTRLHTIFPGNVPALSGPRLAGKIAHSVKASTEAWSAL